MVVLAPEHFAAPVITVFSRFCEYKWIIYVLGQKNSNVNHLSNILGENSAYLLADYTQLIPNRAESDNSEENSEIEIRT